MLRFHRQCVRRRIARVRSTTREGGRTENRHAIDPLPKLRIFLLANACFRMGMAALSGSRLPGCRAKSENTEYAARSALKGRK
jgi:hypothetical protein